MWKYFIYTSILNRKYLEEYLCENCARLAREGDRECEIEKGREIEWRQSERQIWQ